MIKVLQLIFEPVMTWDEIALDRRSVAWILLLFLTPLIVLTLGIELSGLVYFGKAAEYVGRPLEFGRVKVSRELLITYGIAQFFSSYLLVALGARLMRSIAHTFHSRHSYNQCFTVTAYALGPLFLLRACDAIPGMAPWATFAIGIALTVATLYHGVPRVLDPDPPHAFGLYLSSLILLASLSALTRLLTLLVLDRKFHF